MEQGTFNELKQVALRLLAGREHSRVELHRKLKSRAGDAGLLEQLLDELESERSLSDQRFTEEYIESRKRKGFGPMRIRRDLQEKGIARELVSACLDEHEHDWDTLLQQVARRKFGTASPADFRQWAKQARFLEYRGFAPEQIRSLLSRGVPHQGD